MQRIYKLEGELALLLRISHKYGKSGAQVIFSMGALEHLSSCRALNMQIKVLLFCHLVYTRTCGFDWSKMDANCY